jgi:hypothetical protein
MELGATAADRFRGKYRITESGCWEWTAARGRKGYGRMGISSNRTALAHRVSWELARGPIPDGALVLHSCDNPPCVNPDHLWLGSFGDNYNDMVKKGRAVFRGATGERHPMRLYPELAESFRGEGNPCARLKEYEIITIRGLVAAGCSQRSVARAFNVTQTRVWQIANRRAWVHV